MTALGKKRLLSEYATFRLANEKVNTPFLNTKSQGRRQREL